MFVVRPLYRQATFLLGVASFAQLPRDEGFEVAFAGRSNVGKSSALNALCGQRALARVSKTPGRTQQLNFFTLDEQRRIVDLPGYGYAEAPLAVKRQWSNLIDRYLRERRSLRGMVLLMDARHPLKDLDCQMIEWCQAANIPWCILLTKVDKLSRNEVQASLRQVTNHFEMAATDPAQVMPFSSLKKTGLESLQRWLDAWLRVS